MNVLQAMFLEALAVIAVIRFLWLWQPLKKKVVEYSFICGRKVEGLVFIIN